MTTAHQEDIASTRLLIALFVVWIIASSGTLVSLELFTVESGFLFGFIGFLVLSEIFAPERPSASWRKVRWVKVVGFIILGYFLSMRVIEIVS
jgi:multisubunit Na+/H+ antiporter MnhE subunit